MNDNKPTLIAYAVKDARNDEQKSIWTRIGAAWAHENDPLASVTASARQHIRVTSSMRMSPTRPCSVTSSTASGALTITLRTTVRSSAVSSPLRASS